MNKFSRIRDAYVFYFASPVLAVSLRDLIDQTTIAAKNVVEGLIFLSFIVGLGLYVLPYIESLQAHGKSIMTRAAIAQVIFSLASLLFRWLATFGG